MAPRNNRRFATALALVGKLYEAAAEPRLWPRFLDDFAQATSSEGTVLWLHDTSDSSARLETPDASFACNVRFAPGFMDSYAAHYTYTNVWLTHIDTLREGEFANSSTWYPEAELRRTEYYTDWLRPQGLGYALGGPVLKRGSSIAMFSVLRPERRGPFEEDDLRLMRLLMPHLRRGCLLHQRLARLRTESSAVLNALDQLDSAVWLLDAEGRLLVANRVGRELDRRHDGLWIDASGRPAAADTNDQQALSRVVSETIAVAMGLRIGGEATACVHRGGGAAPLQLTAYPLRTTLRWQGAAAALFITDPSLRAPLAPEAWVALFDLTKTEARLALALAQGRSIRDYCEANGVTENTARTHLKRLHSKTGTRRQAELVSLLVGARRRSKPWGLPTS